jgi:cytochrome c-type biogenesis protein CcmF
LHRGQICGGLETKVNLGDWTLKLGTLLAVVALVAAIRWARGRDGSRRTFVLAYHGMTACLVLAAALLMAAILRHDFRFDYVIGYSSRDLPTLYLVSAFWAGQAGTYLLWGLFAALAGYALFHRRAFKPAPVMAAWVPTVLFLFALMLTTEGNPFRLAASVPPDGRGMNPLLQDPWMASHPPLVFLGYVAMAVPAVLALVAALYRDVKGWLDPALRWSIAAFVVLGAGIVLGGFWAYKVLGWGGYWGWDPVENASLVPWLVVAALVHGLLIQKSVGALPRTNLVLALGGFWLVLYATFLTRSGVLADFSVHSFPAGSVYRLLVGILLLVLAVSAWAMFRARKEIGRPVEIAMAWPMVLSVAIGLLCVSAVFVLVGTSWPILSGFFGTPSAPQPTFYNRVSLPVYIALAALLGVAPSLAWAQQARKIWLPRTAGAFAVGALSVVLVLAGGARGPGVLLLFFVGAAALAANAVRFLELAQARLLNTGAAIAHIGFAMMILGIVASSAWGTRQKAELPLGQPVPVLGNQLSFLGHVPGSEPKNRFKIGVRSAKGGESVSEFTIYSTGRDANGQESSYRKPAIVRRLSGDLYLSPLAIERHGNTPVLMVDATTKPLVGVLWAGTILLGVGCGVAAARRIQLARRLPVRPTVRPGKPRPVPRSRVA